MAGATRERETLAVVFDLGNVLITWDRRFLYEQLIPDPGELDYFLDNVLTLEENAVLDRGTPLAAMTADLADRRPDHAALIDAFRTRWIETIGPTIDESVEILESLHGTVPLYALSNWGKDTFAQVEETYSWFSRFDGMVISGREGIVKPEPAIYRLLLDRYDLRAESTLFIDDSQANVDAARGVGIDAVLFESPGGLRSDLLARGLRA